MMYMLLESIYSKQNKLVNLSMVTEITQFHDKDDIIYCIFTYKVGWDEAFYTSLEDIQEYIENNQKEI